MLSNHLYETLPSLIKSIGQRHFYDQVVCSIQALDPISNIRVVSYSKNNHPVFLDDSTMTETDEIYCHSAYLLDPMYDVIHNQHHDELVTLESLVTEDFCNTRYYDTFYQRLGWSNETNIIIGTTPDTKICIVYTTKDNLSSTVSAIQALMPYLSSIKAAIQTHESVARSFRKNQIIENVDISYSKNLTSRLDFYQLTKREKEIVTLILEGMSSIAIADKCFVSQGTIKNHRKNIYRKLNVKSQAELFRNFI